MQETIFYVAPAPTVGSVRDFANAKVGGSADTGKVRVRAAVDEALRTPGGT